MKTYSVQVKMSSGVTPAVSGEKALQKRIKRMLNDLGYLVEYIDVIELGVARPSASHPSNVIPLKPRKST